MMKVVIKRKNLVFIIAALIMFVAYFSIGNRFDLRYTIGAYPQAKQYVNHYFVNKSSMLNKTLIANSNEKSIIPVVHPIPVMILVGDRISYFRSVFSAVVQANKASTRHVFLIGENAVDMFDKINDGQLPQCKCLLHILNLDTGGEIKNSDPAINLKHIWYKSMHAVWESQSLQSYSDDIVFLEDDVVPSPDFFIALEFASAFKRKSNNFQVIAMGGWGGENQVNANATTFTMKSAVAFPTMGYAFNRALWNEIMKVENIVTLDVLRTDWAESLAAALWARAYDQFFPLNLLSFHRHGQIKLLQPTLSRVWHIGVFSQVGSVHQTSSYKWPSRPSWELIGENNLLKDSAGGMVLKGMHDVFGFETIHWEAFVDRSGVTFPLDKRHSIFKA